MSAYASNANTQEGLATLERKVQNLQASADAGGSSTSGGSSIAKLLSLAADDRTVMFIATFLARFVSRVREAEQTSGTLVQQSDQAKSELRQMMATAALHLKQALQAPGVARRSSSGVSLPPQMHLAKYLAEQQVRRGRLLCMQLATVQATFVWSSAPLGLS